jgi:hypothetical protein
MPHSWETPSRKNRWNREHPSVRKRQAESIGRNDANSRDGSAALAEHHSRPAQGINSHGIGNEKGASSFKRWTYFER